MISLLFWLFLLLLSIPVRMDREYEKPSALYRRLLDAGFRYLCFAARVRPHVSGLEKLPEDERFLFVSNHRSRFDPMVQSAAMGKTPLAFISKPSNFKIPIGRKYMKRCCYLPIDRENAKNALGTIQRAAELISTGAASVGVYPEGHRGTGDTLQDFRAGCFKVATKANCPIVVATIWGTDRISRNFPFRKTDVWFDIIRVIPAGERRTALLSSEIRRDMEENLAHYTKENNHDLYPVQPPGQ